MGESETGIMATRGEPFSFSLQKPPVTSQPGVQGMRLAYNADGSSGTPIYKPITSTSPTYPVAGNGNAAVGVDVSAPMSSGGAPPTVVPPGVNMNVSVSGTGGPTGEQPVKKKRGRPRKYGPDGAVALAIAPGGTPVSVGPPSGGFSPPSAGHGLSSASVNISGGNGNLPGLVSPTNSVKKPRGRPPGSGKKHQLDALGSAGLGFTPHVITVKAGEDVSSKIMSLSQNGPRAVCILSANGAISNVTLRQPAIRGGTVTYEGRFEILSLSGSFLLSENEGHRSRTGGLSVSLSGPDGRVLGGGVAGLLTAASPVQVVVGSFIADGQKEPKPVNHMEHYSAPTKIAPVGGLTGGSSPSHGTLSESSGGAGSPLNHSTGACNNNNPPAMSSTPWK